MTADTRHLRPHPTQRMTDPTFAAVVATVIGPPGLVGYPPRSPALCPPPAPLRRQSGLAPRLALGGGSVLLLLALLSPGRPPARAVVSSIVIPTPTTPGAVAPPAAAPPPVAPAPARATLVAPTARQTRPPGPAPLPLAVPPQADRVAGGVETLPPVPAPLPLAVPLGTVWPTLPPPRLPPTVWPTLVPPTLPRRPPPTPLPWTPPSAPPPVTPASRLPPPLPTVAPVGLPPGPPTPGTGAAGNDWSADIFNRSATIHAEPTP